MDKTIGYVLCCQSPALFLLTLVLLFASLLRRRRHKFIAAIDVILAVASAMLGVALYFIGMRYEHFTIDDFYHVRTVGWVGFGVVAVVSVVTGRERPHQSGAHGRRGGGPCRRPGRQGGGKGGAGGGKGHPGAPDPCLCRPRPRSRPGGGVRLYSPGWVFIHQFGGNL